jgi:hypothetical protein
VGLRCLLRRFSGSQISVKMFRFTNLFKNMLRFKNLFKKMFRFTISIKMFRLTNLFKMFRFLFKKIFMFANLFFSRRIGQHCSLPLANEKHVLFGLKQKYLLAFLRNFGNFHGTYRHPHILYPEKSQTFLRNFS